MGNLFNQYFEMKNDTTAILSILNRHSFDNAYHVDFHDVKSLHSMCERSWKQTYFPCIGYCCQWGDAFLDDHVCTPMTDEERLALCNNSDNEWQQEIKSSSEYCIIRDHKDWWSEFNYGNNIFEWIQKKFLYQKLDAMRLCTQFLL